MRAALVWALLTILAGCSSREVVWPEEEARPERSVPADSDSPQHGAAGPRVIFLGDSLTAGYGLSEEEAFPALIGARLAAEGRPIRLVNAGVSGDTSAGGLRRLAWLLAQRPHILVVELGANDGLRGLPLEQTESNLRQIIERSVESGSQVLLLGMQVPPNYGADYAQGFAAIYPRVARELGIPLVHFLLDGVGGRLELNLADGIHPTAEGHQILTANVLPYLEELLDDLEARPETLAPFAERTWSDDDED
jgi:acyl-CoA thioesterase-1